MDHFSSSARNVFAASPVERSAHLRKDETWLSEQLSAPSSRFLPVWQGKNLLREGLRPVYLSAAEAAPLLEAGDAILLGVYGEHTYFGLPVTDGASAGSKGEWAQLRYQASLLSEVEASLAIMAKALAHWHERHRFCSDCGAATASREGGYLRVCRGAQAHKHFPRTDPAIIVLVHRGESCLLARQPNWPAERYSTLAGFVEPGESLEDAVAREVAEETSVRVGRVVYQSSQPWPFPSSLMVGYLAEARSTEIALLDQELERASWFSRAELSGSLRAGTLKLPPEVAISFRLIETWFDDGENGRLRKLLD